MLHISPNSQGRGNPKFEYRNSKQIQMNKIRITKTEKPWCRFGFVLNFEHSNFNIVSDFGFRYSDLGHHLRVSETGHIAKIGDRTFETMH